MRSRNTNSAMPVPNAMTDMASGMLDRDGDGSSLDDIASMAFSYLSKK